MRPAFCILAALGFALAGCEDRLAHPFGGYTYDVLGDCLDDAGAVDVIDGPNPGVCAEDRCWYSPGGDIYVTTSACDAPTGYVEHTGDPKGSPCALALAALAQGEFGLCAD